MDWKNHSTATLDKTKLNYIDKYVVGTSVLDMGCATGIYTNYLSKKFEVVGADGDSKILSKAKKSYENKVFKKENIEKLSFKNNSFDTSVVFDVLEHVDDVRSIKELARVTKKIIIGSVPRSTDFELSSNYLLFGHHQDTSHLRTYTKDELKKLFKNISYKKIIIKETHPISTESLLIDILSGNIILKKMLRKLILFLLRPKKFYSNLMFIIYLK